MGQKSRLPSTLAILGQAIIASGCIAFAVGCEGKRPAYADPGAPPPAPPIAAAATAATAPPPSPPSPLLPDSLFVDGDPKTVRMVIDADPIHLNPDLDPDQWGYRISYDAIYEPLLRVRPPRRETPETPIAASEVAHALPELEPVLAERWSFEDAGRVVVLHLRKGIVFHDGKPLAPSDVVFTFERIQAGKTHAPRLQSLLADIKSVKVAGPDGVRITATRPTAYLLQEIAEVAILPEHVFGHGDINYQPANRHPVGTGPFRLAEWERGKRIVLERFERYAGPPPRANRIEIAIEPDAARSLGEAKRVEIDVLGRLPAAWIPEQLDSPTLSGRYVAERIAPPRLAFVLWNTDRAPLDDPAVRRALSLAVDRKRVLDDARHGVGRIALSAPPRPMEEATADAEPLTSTAPWQQPPPPNATMQPSLPPPERGDPKAAGALLEAAGVLRSANGVRLRGGHPVRLSLLVPSGSREAEAAAKRVVDGLAKVGLAVDVVVGDLSVLMLRIKKGLFDGALLEWAGRDDEDLASLWKTHGRENYGAFSSREVDAVLEELRRPDNDDPSLRAHLRERLAAALSASAPALFLYAPDEVYLYSRRLVPPRSAIDFPLLRDVGPLPSSF